MDPLTVNLHTHTCRCHHAQGDVVDYVRVAEVRDLQVLGFSDHAPLPDGRWADVRMTMAELPEYLEAIRQAQVSHPRLRLLAGLECEPGFGFEDFYREEFLGRLGLDFLIAGVHWIPDPVRSCFSSIAEPAALARFVQVAVTAMASRLFVYLAHPDVFGWCHDRWSDDCAQAAVDLAQAALATGCPLELNSYGFRRTKRTTSEGARAAYPWTPFWEVVAAVGAPVVLGADAHNPPDVPHALEVVDLARRLGLRLVDPCRRLQRP